ncbi:MAG: hypothetical protein IH889_07950 [Planctomycetes bacterium]|nr:hypothetical protein [Planctomycetota bacterium]
MRDTLLVQPAVQRHSIVADNSSAARIHALSLHELLQRDRQAELDTFVEDIALLDLAPGEVLTPAQLARTHLARHRLTPHLLVHAGLEEEFADLPPGDREAVVVGDVDATTRKAFGGLRGKGSTAPAAGAAQRCAAELLAMVSAATGSE